MDKFNILLNRILKEGTVLVEGHQDMVDDFMDDFGRRPAVGMEFKVKSKSIGQKATKNWDTGAPVTKTFKGKFSVDPGEYMGIASIGVSSGEPVVYLIGDNNKWFFIQDVDAEDIIKDNLKKDKSGELKDILGM
jgi:hypothetical protein